MDTLSLISFPDDADEDISNSEGEFEEADEVASGENSSHIVLPDMQEAPRVGRHDPEEAFHSVGRNSDYRVLLNRADVSPSKIAADTLYHEVHSGAVSPIDDRQADPDYESEGSETG